MIGTLAAGTREATVVGGGIAGLLAAYYLDRAGLEVSLLEASNRLGGLLATSETSEGIAESAAHMIQMGSVQRALFDDLGVPYVSLRPESRARFIARNGKLTRFPLSPSEALAAFLRAYFVLAAPSEKYTVADWARRHLGEAAVEYLLDPFVAGIFGVAPGELSVEAAFPQFNVPRGHSLLSYALSRARKRGKKDKKSICAPEAGMGALIAALESRLRERLGERIRVGARVSALPSSPNIVLTVPAQEAAIFLVNEDAELASRLAAIEYVPLVSITAFLDQEGFVKAPNGIGVLMPSCEKRECLGILFNSSAFPGRVTDESRWVSVTALLGGGRDPSAISATDEELKNRLLRDLRDLLGYRSAQARLVIHRWPCAIPKYDQRVLETWQAARRGWCAKPGHLLFGNFAGQVSLRGMMESAHNLAASLQP